jgi:hypothetical protein
MIVLVVDPEDPAVQAALATFMHHCPDEQVKARVRKELEAAATSETSREPLLMREPGEATIQMTEIQADIAQALVEVPTKGTEHGKPMA